MEDLTKHSTELEPQERSEEEQAERLDRFCSRQDIAVWVLAFKKDELIGRTAVFVRQIEYEGQDLNLGGIGKIVVSDSERQKGAATAMMKTAMKQLFELECDVAHLCTNLSNQWLVNFYKKFGFVLLGKEYTYLGRSGKRYTDEDGMIAPIKSKKLFKQILNSAKKFDIGTGNW